MLEIFYSAPSPTKPKPAPIVMIRQHRSWVLPLLIVSAVVVVGMVGHFFYQYGMQVATHNAQAIIQNQKQESEKIYNQVFQKLQNQKQESEKIYNQVIQTLNQLEDDYQDLTEEVAFYKRLLKFPTLSKSSTPEVVITNFTLGTDDNSGRYPYKLVLTQWAKKVKVATGRVKIHLVGKVNGTTKRLNMKSITENSIEALKYKVHYFQRIKGYLQVPKELIPHHLIISILPAGGKKANEIRLPWQKLPEQE